MKKIIKNMDIPLMIAVTLLCVIGVVFILSASSVRSVFETIEGTPYYYFKRQIIFLVFSFLAGFIILCKSSKKIDKYTGLLYIIGVISLIAVLIFASPVNGTRGWIDFKLFTVQPSECMKLVMILFMGKFFSNPSRKMDRGSILIFLGMILLPIVLIFCENDTGTAIVMGLILLITFFSIPLKEKFLQRLAFLTISSLAIILLVLSLSGVELLSGYRKDRFNTKEPCKRYYEVGSGYQICNGYIAINNGGLFGSGIGNSTQKYQYLPEAHTDFIFPIIVEEIGVIPSIIVLLIYIFVLFRLFRISQIASTMRGSIISFGVFVYIALHFVFNIGGVLSILPLTGVPLLFLSYGGSSLFTAVTSIFVVERIAAESKIENSKNKLKKI